MNKNLAQHHIDLLYQSLMSWCFDCDAFLEVYSSLDYQVYTPRFCPACGANITESNSQKSIEFRNTLAADQSWSELQKWASGEYEDIAFPNTGIYVIYSHHGHYKIGLSDNIQKRMAQLSTGTPERLSLLHVVETSNLAWCEGFLHNRLAQYRVRPDREWFRLNIPQLEWICSFAVLEPPKSTASQLTMLDLLESFPQ